MRLLFDTEPGRVDSVLHPTDLSQASERAFHHALAIAIRHSAEFTLLHAIGRRATDNWAGFPSVRTKLAQWHATGSLDGIEDKVRKATIRKQEVDIRDPVAACMQYIERNRIDMIVLATEGRRGLSRLIRASRAESLARRSRLPTLFVPEGGRTFVDGDTGALSLSRILVPVDPATDPRPAMLEAVRSAALLENPDLEVTLLHVGDGEEEATEVPHLPFCRWNVIRRSGNPVEQILAVGEEVLADAIYMSTKWQRASLGRVEGGVTEAVLADAECPVMVVPVAGSQGKS